MHGKSKVKRAEGWNGLQVFWEFATDWYKMQNACVEMSHIFVDKAMKCCFTRPRRPERSAQFLTEQHIRQGFGFSKIIQQIKEKKKKR